MEKIKRSLVINLLVVVVCLVLFRSVSYSLNDNPTKDNKDLLIKTGNMQIVLNMPNEKYELLNLTDNNKLKSGYDFSIKNTGDIPIEYYELRLVNQEGKVSTLPHKYLDFIVTIDGKEESVKNLGDNDSIIYSGYNLSVGKNISFSLKMWPTEDINAIGKELYGAIEVTLYQKYEVYKNYVLYESEGSTNVPVRTSIYNPITSIIPKKEGYRFIGWKTKDGLTRYYSGDTYEGNIGTTLYAIWEKV